MALLIGLWILDYFYCEGLETHRERKTPFVWDRVGLWRFYLPGLKQDILE